jgi:hypothetical protein
MRARPWPFLLLSVLVMLLLAVGGCRCSRTPSPTQTPPKPPSIRLYLVGGIAGALEPCGCVKDMLGGVDHFAALVKNESGAAPNRLLFGAGQMLFMDPVLDEKRGEQDRWKAESIARALATVGFSGWAPGHNDWAAGGEALGKLTAGRLALFGENVEGTPAPVKARVFEAGGERVGVVGVSTPLSHGKAPEGVTIGDARAALERGARELDKQGAKIKLALLAMPRGEALRLAEFVPGFQVFALGKPFDRGELNDTPTPPVLVGKTLVVEAPNHLQAVAVVDFFVKDGKYEFADASQVAAEEGRLSLRGRIAELEGRLAQKGLRPDDARAGSAELVRLRGELAKAERREPAPDGSHFQYRLVEIKDKLGSTPDVAAAMSSYYKRVNEHNRVAFADRKPEPAPEGQSSFVGVERCTTCHQEERVFWDSTRHAKAYETLSTQHKEFNLDCVGCHVTGYQEPGGSTVTHVQNLTDVQCETCHGAGSRHADNPGIVGAIERSPARTLCGPKCHHPPHVPSSWSVDVAWSQILGPGHGK